MRWLKAPWAAGQSAVQEGLSDPSASCTPSAYCERGWHGGGPEPQGRGLWSCEGCRGLSPTELAGLVDDVGPWLAGVVQGPERGQASAFFSGAEEASRQPPRELMEGCESCGGGTRRKVASESHAGG